MSHRARRSLDFLALHSKPPLETGTSVTPTGQMRKQRPREGKWQNLEVLTPTHLHFLVHLWPHPDRARWVQRPGAVGNWPLVATGNPGS